MERWLPLHIERRRSAVKKGMNESATRLERFGM